MTKLFSKNLFVLAVIVSTSLLQPTQAAEKSKRPNVLLILADDQRPDTIAALGNQHIQTPHLDRLVHEGTSFSRAYCMGSMQPAVCAPSRAMILTGRTLFRATKGGPYPLLPEVLRKAGYATFGTGKWHHDRGAFARSFSHGGAIFFGGMSDHLKVPIHDYDPSGKYPDRDGRLGKKFSSELFADATIDFLKQHAEQRADQPFFAYVSFTAPHDPRMPPKKYRDMVDPSKLPLPVNFLPKHPFDNGEMKIRDEALAPWPRTPEIVRQHLAEYYGMISHMDAQIGRILAELDKTGQAENTIIIFAADHGLAVGSHGLLGKQNVYEHSMGTPMIIGGSGLPRGKRTEAFAYLLDLFPTICQLADVPIPATVEGQSLASIVRGKAAKVRDSVFTAYRVQRAVRDDRWKLIRYQHIDKIQLFDLKTDPHELNNLADDPDHRQQVETMQNLLDRWHTDLGSTGREQSAE